MHGTYLPDAVTPRVERLTPRIGAAITGIEIRDADDEQVGFVRGALLAHRVVFLRDQHLTGDEQLAFASRFGDLTLAHPTLRATSRNPELFDLDSMTGAAANHWHTDVTFVERPPSYSFLRAIIIPEVGGDTVWANTVAAYRDLRPDLRELADKLRAIHTNGADYARVDVASHKGKLSQERLDHLQRFVSTVYESEHPVVRIHPETGERALLLGGFAHRLTNHPTSESVDLLRTLQAYVTRPENCVRWRWREGDLAIWDNRSTQHYAVHDYGSERRKVQRVTTAGVVPVGVDGLPSQSISGDPSLYYGNGSALAQGPNGSPVETTVG